MLERKLLMGMIKLHILHWARKGEVEETRIIDTFSNIYYESSPQTIQDMLNELLENRYLSVREDEGTVLYSTTESGTEMLLCSLDTLQGILGDLMGELDRDRAR